jgi:predicted acyltransferase
MTDLAKGFRSLRAQPDASSLQAIIGFLAGEFLDRTKDRRHALAELLPAACLLIAAGFLCDYWLGLPINKKLWTSFYTLYAGGWSLLTLGLIVWAADGHGRRRALSFFNIFGRNPLLAYIASERLVVTLFTVRATGADGTPRSAFARTYEHTAMALAGDNAVGSFVFAVAYTLAIWLLSWGCYRRGIVIKVWHAAGRARARLSVSGRGAAGLRTRRPGSTPSRGRLSRARPRGGAGRAAGSPRGCLA